MTEIEKRICEKYRKEQDAKKEMIGVIMEKYNDVSDHLSFERRLNSLWDLAVSIGREIGTFEGYSKAQKGEPLGASCRFELREETMLTQRDIANKRYRLIYSKTPFDSITKPDLKVESGLVFEGNGDICDVFNRFMASNQFLFKDYIIRIEYWEELP